MGFRLLHLVATLIDACDPQPGRGLDHLPADTIRVVATLRRCMACRARIDLLAKMDSLLVVTLRGHLNLILDSCSVRANRGDLTGPNPTDRGQRGTKYHVAVDGDGVPVACATTTANINDTLLFERLFLTVFAVMGRIRIVFADKGYDTGCHSDLCRQLDVEPRIHRRGQPRGLGLVKRRWRVERSMAWLLEDRRLALREGRLGFRTITPATQPLTFSAVAV